MLNNSPARLTDPELLDTATHAVDRERTSTADLLALLAEVDLRRLHLREGYASMFVFCTQALHLSEAAASSRITAARASRRFPVLLTRLREGAITLTTIGLLSPHLTDENHEALLEAAHHKSKNDLQKLIAALHPQPDIASSVRRLPSPRHREVTALPLEAAAVPAPERETNAEITSALSTSRRSLVAPLAPERYLMRVTLSGDAHRKLERARDLLRHSIPNGDPAAIVDRALTVLVEQLERTKVAATARPRKTTPSTSARSRHVPAPVKREVWTRDEGRRAFVGASGRCAETGFLEFHHVHPFAEDGATSIENLELRCRAHNAWEAQRLLDDDERNPLDLDRLHAGSEVCS